MYNIVALSQRSATNTKCLSAVVDRSFSLTHLRVPSNTPVWTRRRKTHFYPIELPIHIHCPTVCVSTHRPPKTISSFTIGARPEASSSCSIIDSQIAPRILYVQADAWSGDEEDKDKRVRSVLLGANRQGG